MSQSKPLKIIFAGTPEIAKIVLQKILTSGFLIDLVLTKADTKSGRGHRITPSPVKKLAIDNNIEVFQPLSLKSNDDAINKIKNLNPDIMVVCAYGLILPKAMLNIPKLGCVNIHVSLLPRYRGAAPIARAILSGDSVSGVTIMQMDAGLDTGDILLQKELEITPQTTAFELQDSLAVLGGDMIVDYLNNYSLIKPIPQSDYGVTYANKIDKNEALINWHESAIMIDRKIRGFNPSPGCFSYLDGDLIKIWRSKVTSNKSGNSNNPGTIVSATQNGIEVVCGNNTCINILQLQLSGKTRQFAPDYILGHMNLVGKTFTTIKSD